MKDLLDPHRRWIGRRRRAGQNQSDAPPVAIDDSLTLPRTAGPVSVTVLANDIDPEGQPLTLISANAALGTAVAEADGTITYTPPAGTPPGVVQFDTVVYEIADALDQRDTGQIDVIIDGADLQVNVTGENTLAVIADTGAIEIGVTAPSEFAGTWTFTVSDLANGPVNLVPPTISGTAAEGQVLTAAEGLWVGDTWAAPATQSWQWRRAGVDIAGATGASYTVEAGDIGPGLSVAETLSDGFGARVRTSAAVGAAFTPAADAALLGWWDAADATTITASAGSVSAWADKAGGAALLQSFGPDQPATGTRLLNGLNVLDFDGGDFMEVARSLPVSGDVAFHAVLVIDATSNAFDALLSVDATNDFQLDANNAVQFDGRLNTAGTGTPVVLSGGPFAGPVLLSILFDAQATATAEVFVGGVSRAVTGYTVPIDSAVSLLLMSNRSKNARAEGAVGELVITGDLTTRTSYQSYLSAKWGVS